jgi:hypothetical protein
MTTSKHRFPSKLEKEQQLRKKETEKADTESQAVKKTISAEEEGKEHTNNLAKPLLIKNLNL